MCYNTSEETLSVLKYVYTNIIYLIYILHIYAEYESSHIISIFQVIFENITSTYVSMLY